MTILQTILIIAVGCLVILYQWLRYKGACVEIDRRLTFEQRLFSKLVDIQNDLTKVKLIVQKQNGVPMGDFYQEAADDLFKTGSILCNNVSHKKQKS